MTEPIPRNHLRPVARFAHYDRASREDQGDLLAAFLRLSVSLTGFSEAELSSTGMTRVYFDELGQIVGARVRESFLSGDRSSDALMKSPKDGPLARNVIRMWYLGQWKHLTPEWLALLDSDAAATFDEFHRNTDHIVSAAAYQEGLVWVAIGSHPMGAKQPGFGSWGEPPR